MRKNNVLRVRKVVREDGARAFSVSPFLDAVCRKVLHQFAEVLGGSGEEELVICTVWAA